MDDMKKTEMAEVERRARRVAAELERLASESTWLAIAYGELLDHHEASEASEALLLECAQCEALPLGLRERVLEAVGA